MAQNIINERWVCDASSTSLRVPSGGGVVSVPGFGFYEKTAHRSVGIPGASISSLAEADSVFIKRIRIYSPWLAFGTQIRQTEEVTQIGLMLEDSDHLSSPVGPLYISSFSMLGEWVDVNAILPQNPNSSGRLYLFPLMRAIDMVFPSSIPDVIVGKSVYLYLQIELAHTLSADS